MIELIKKTGKSIWIDLSSILYAKVSATQVIIYTIAASPIDIKVSELSKLENFIENEKYFVNPANIAMIENKGLWNVTIKNGVVLKFREFDLDLLVEKLTAAIETKIFSTEKGGDTLEHTATQKRKKKKVETKIN